MIRFEIKGERLVVTVPHNPDFNARARQLRGIFSPAARTCGDPLA